MDKPMRLTELTEEEANALLDRIFLKTTGKTYAADAAPPSPPDNGPDSLEKIRRDFPDLFARTPIDPSV